MGILKDATSGDLFQHAFNQFLVGNHYVALFDHGWATLHGSGYHSTVYKYALGAGYAPIEIEGQQVSESTLVKNICLRSDFPHPDLSSFRRISADMEERTSGLIIVHNAHQLSDNATHLLARLVTFIKRKKSDWKIALFADSQSIKQLNLAQLAVDEYHPDSFLELNWKPESSIEVKHSNLKLDGAGNTIKYIIGATFGLLAIAVGLKLIY